MLRSENMHDDVNQTDINENSVSKSMKSTNKSKASNNGNGTFIIGDSMLRPIKGILKWKLKVNIQFM